ncbi:hypothetical protein HK107_10245 [Parvularcula sp. ZS-1/3]|uniref:DUF2306 domain-containing protein n=1 Tax=Parvularcula mediterranea TaxID=2732508 RepID=A0A7Y3W5W8_9PROT|nr:hypothetical protein [Parvularcula mediterranea]NNU16701.1 hypothetical protein [Parvularcula mediterranea]
MNEFWAKGYSDPHMLNILVHVGFGTLGILVGLVQFARPKGDRLHRLAGRVFMACGGMVIATSLVGIASFNHDPFLMTLTVAAFYHGASGWRVLKIKETGPGATDHALSAGALAYCLGYVLYARVSGDPGWSAVTIYASLGAVGTVASYDLLRNIGGAEWLRRTWLCEHVYKTVGALGALVSAAVGNVFEDLGVVAQVGPSAIFLLLSLAFMLPARRVRH